MASFNIVTVLNLPYQESIEHMLVACGLRPIQRTDWRIKQTGWSVLSCYFYAPPSLIARPLGSQQTILGYYRSTSKLKLIHMTFRWWSDSGKLYKLTREKYIYKQLASVNDTGFLY